jgi:glycosyltransferase involved in cell wall biosynthesis
VPGAEAAGFPDRVNSCQIVPSIEVRHGGPSKSVLGLATAIAANGNEVELLTTEPGAGWEKRDGKLSIRAFHRNWPATVCASASLRKYLQAAKADVVHHHSIWLRTLHYAHRASLRNKSLLVVSPRGMMDPWAWRHHSRRKALARAVIHPGAFEAVDGWHATSVSEEADIRALGFKQPICVAPNGVAEPAADVTSAAADHWLKLFPAAAKKRVALFYSRFHQKKRLLELIDAWLEAAPVDWILLVVGIPEQYSPRMIEDYALRAGGAGRVRAYDGSGHPAPYPIASLFLLPSHGENFGLSIAEALSNGVPALVTDTTPWAELNGTGAGWWVPWGEYAAALSAATAESQESLRLRGAIAKEWVCRRFSWKSSASTLVDFYSRLRS